MTQKPDDLLPCPFCGDALGYDGIASYYHPQRAYEKDDCLLGGASFRRNRLSEWQSRQPTANNEKLHPNKNGQIGCFYCSFTGKLADECCPVCSGTGDSNTKGKLCWKCQGNGIWPQKATANNEKLREALKEVLRRISDTPDDLINEDGETDYYEFSQDGISEYIEKALAETDMDSSLRIDSEEHGKTPYRQPVDCAGSDHGIDHCRQVGMPTSPPAKTLQSEQQNFTSGDDSLRKDDTVGVTATASPDTRGASPAIHEQDVVDKITQWLQYDSQHPKYLVNPLTDSEKALIRDVVTAIAAMPQRKVSGVCSEISLTDDSYGVNLVRHGLLNTPASLDPEYRATLMWRVWIGPYLRTTEPVAVSLEKIHAEASSMGRFALTRNHVKAVLDAAEVKYVD